MEGTVLEDYKHNVNDNEYKKGQIIQIVELNSFEDCYAIYTHDGLDWIPKGIVEIQ